MWTIFSEVSGISPSEGSMEGGTILTINGQYFDQTDSPAKVLVGGMYKYIQSDRTLVTYVSHYSFTYTVERLGINVEKGTCCVW